jgi:hypothetical protein
MVPELRESKANKMRARRKEKGEQRVGVHGAVFSGELGRNSGEQLPRIGALPLQAEASTSCAKRRRCSEEDGGSGGGLWTVVAGTANSGERAHDCWREEGVEEE